MSLNGSEWTGMSEIEPETDQKPFPKPILIFDKTKILYTDKCYFLLSGATDRRDSND